jgi:sugar phosphate isomerase/epimerase
MDNTTAPPPVSVQLYTLREAAAVDFPAVLARLGAKGYPGVELAGFGGLEPDALSRALTDADLTISSAHVGITDDRDEFAAALDAHQALGCDTVVIPALPPATFADPDGVCAAADRINGAHELTQARGLTLGYHNHFWEIAPMPDGRPALLHLFEQVAPAVIAEVDVYWAQLGGTDPKDLLRALGTRVGLLHVKDGPADEPRAPMVAVGEGVVDIPGVLAAAPTATWHIVELDRCATDMFDAVEASYDYLVGNGLSTGRS